ncbi:MAG: type II/IV secretion system ATPase subunit [Halobacteria archaeon]
MGLLKKRSGSDESAENGAVQAAEEAPASPPPPAGDVVVEEAQAEAPAPKKRGGLFRKKEVSPEAASPPPAEEEPTPPLPAPPETRATEEPPPAGLPEIKPILPPAQAAATQADTGGLVPKEVETPKAAASEEAVVEEESKPEAEVEGKTKGKRKGKGSLFGGGKKAKKPKAVYQPEPYDADRHGPLAVFEGIPGAQEVERYWLEKPYSFAVILYSEETNNRVYHVVEPKLTPFEQTLVAELKSRLQDLLLITEAGDEQDKETIVTEKLSELLLDYDAKLEPAAYYKIRYYIVRDFVKLEKLTAVMADPFIEDVSCNGWQTPLFLFHKKYQNIETNLVYEPESLTSFVIRLAQRAGKHISIANPLVDATMPDGSRIQMTLGDEITTKGTTFTIRKFQEDKPTPINMIQWNTFSSQMMAYLWLCIENGKSLIFSGGTASGKTTAMNAVSLFIPPSVKVISLEDTREIQLPHKNWIPGKTRDSFTPDGQGAVDMYELLRAALRQRPEYLLVGEVRGKEALTLFQAMSTGHTTYSTMHADSIDRVIHRLENPPISVPRTMIEALDIVSVQAQTYTSDGRRVRRCINLVEISEIDPVTKILKTVDIFKWDPTTDTFPEVGISKALEEIRKRRAWTPQELQRQLKNRQMVLDYMAKNKITAFRDVAKIIYTFQTRPDKCLQMIGADGTAA